MGELIRGVCHPGTMERGGKKIALVPVPNRGSPYVLRRTAGTRKDGVRYQSGSPRASVWTRNGHQHRSAGVGRTEEGKESVGCGDRGVGHDRKWTIPPWTDRGERGQLPGRYGIRGVHLGGTDMEEMGSRGGRANQVLGAAVFGRGKSA